MTEKKFISGEGAIFQNKYKKQDGHPDKKGSLLIPKELLKKMAAAFQNGETEMNNKNPPQVCIKMDLATCDRVAKNNNTDYQYAKLEMPYKKVEPQPVTQEAVAEVTDEDIPF